VYPVHLPEGDFLLLTRQLTPQAIQEEERWMNVMIPSRTLRLSMVRVNRQQILPGHTATLPESGWELPCPEPKAEPGLEVESEGRSR
jgi:hypothetical protein